MNTDTTIAKNIRVADEKASYDAACKRLLSEKIILAWLSADKEGNLLLQPDDFRPIWNRVYKFPL